MKPFPPPCSFIYVNILDCKTSRTARSLIFTLSLLVVPVFQGLKHPVQWSPKPCAQPSSCVRRYTAEGIMESDQINACYSKQPMQGEYRFSSH